jgi:trimethylamine:corrinoid methyltransferase-like protein
MPTLLDRTRFETWSKAGSRDFTTRVRATVQKILKEHQPEPLPKDVTVEINRVLDEASRRRI